MRRALTFAAICATSCAAEPRDGKPGPANSGESESPSIESSVANVRRLPLATAEVGATKITVELVAHATYHFPFILHPVGDTTVASTRNRIAPLSGDDTDLQWSSADISNELPPGQYGGIEVELIGGTWPTHVVGVLADTRPRMKSVRRYVRWSANAWQPWQAAPAAGGIYLAFTSWGDKGLLGLQHLDRWSGRSKTFDPSIDVLPKGRGPEIPRAYIPVTLTASATGHVYAIASKLDDHRARLITWGPDGGAALQVLDLPAVAGLTPRAGDVRVVEDRGGVGIVIAGGVGTDAWTPYLVQWDGANWRVWETPKSVRGTVGSVFRRSETGEMWLTTWGRAAPLSEQWVAGRGDVVHAGQAWRIDNKRQWHALELTLDHLPQDARYASVAPRALAVVGHRLWVTMEIRAPSLNRTDDGPCHALASAVL